MRMFTTKCKCGEEITFTIEMAMMTKFCPRCGSIIEVRNGKATVIPVGTPPLSPTTRQATPILEAKLSRPAPPVITPRPEPHPAEASPLERRAEPMGRPKPQEPPRPSPVPQQQQQPQHQQPQHPRGEDTVKRHKSAEEEWANIPIRIIEDEGEAAKAKGARPVPKPAPHVPPAPHAQPPTPGVPRGPMPPHYQHPVPPPAPPKPPYDPYTYMQPQTGARPTGCMVAIIIAVCVLGFFIIFANTSTKTEQKFSNPPETRVPLTTPLNTGTNGAARSIPTPEEYAAYKDKINIAPFVNILPDHATVTFHIKNNGGYNITSLSFDFRFLDESGQNIRTEFVIAVDHAVTPDISRSVTVNGLESGKSIEIKMTYTGVPLKWKGKCQVAITAYALGKS